MSLGNWLQETIKFNNFYSDKKLFLQLRNLLASVKILQT